MTSAHITAEDVLRSGSRYRDCELWDGMPMVREPSGGWAEEVASRVVAPLAVHVRDRNLGWVFLSSQGFLLARRPDRLLAPDGAYVSRARLPAIPPRGFIELAPDFAVEVRSPDDTWEQTVEKCGIWIAHGAGVVWGIDPMGRVAAVFRPGTSPVVRRGPREIDASPVLPGFRIQVADLFVGLVEPST